MEQHTVTMKAVLLFCVFSVVALTVAGAPTYTEGEVPQYLSQQQLEAILRQRRSQYVPQYVSPCAAASSMQVPAFAASPYQGYAAVPQYGYAAPHYRSVDEQTEQELLGFSDMDRVPIARMGGYGAAPAAATAHGLSTVGGQVLTQATTGTALGVFPNANVGGCSVPLLFSCSPTIVPGHMMQSQPQLAPVSAGLSSISSGAADSYRLVEEPVHHDIQDQHEEVLTDEHLNFNPVQESSQVSHQ